MTRDPRYDILFEPVQIGPVTAKNRFYQVPHCNGMGYRDPTAAAVMRETKAEGGWAVVCTEQVEIHHTSEITPYIEGRLWDERDIPALARMVDCVHKHNALAGIELCYNGMNGPNFYTREVPMGPAHLPIASFTNDPVQARAMTKKDIANLRRWHRTAALRSKQAGFDIVYVYAGHSLGAFHHFISRRYNQRSDEYGGSLENRIRLLRETIEDTKEAVGDRCAVALRISVDEFQGPAGLNKEEFRDIIGLLAELPDLWDFCLAGWENDSQTSRFSEEAVQEQYVKGLKQMTSKPVVGVGRFTSPDLMVRQIKQGILDFIGAARPSIADPFLPNKIEQGELENIRECIGCNICVSSDFTMAPVRCTQNPTMAEEWRKGWHPERIHSKGSESTVLVVGAGPAGLECTRALGQRGYQVTLAEASTELGGRVALESRLPGLSAWGRVSDYRQQQIQRMSNVDVYLDNRLDAESVLELGCNHVVIATGSYWRRDGVARLHTQPIAIASSMELLIPDDLLKGEKPGNKNVLIYDDDHYYIGGIIAEVLAKEDYQVTLLTPAADVSNWTHHTMEQHRIQERLLECGVKIMPHKYISEVAGDHVKSHCVFTQQEAAIECNAVVLVTSRLPHEELLLALEDKRDDWQEAGIQSVTAIGDASAPATIAHAVYTGHRYAQELDGPDLSDGDVLPFKREIAELLPYK